MHLLQATFEFDMFKESTNTNISGSAAGLASVPSGALADEELMQIRDRLDRDLPKGPYIAEAQFARLLGIDKKSLSNKRSAQSRATHKRYPIPIHIGGCRQLLYPRPVILDWIAKEELDAMARTVHRCR